MMMVRSTGSSQQLRAIVYVHAGKLKYRAIGPDHMVQAL